MASLREALEPYRDAGAAERAGCHGFHSELPMKMYHFTNYRHGAATAYRFDPGRPPSLLYEKAQGRYTLMGAMYTAPAVFSEDPWHQRVPLRLAQWHLHVNICVAPPGTRGRQLFTTFGRMGSLATPEACAAARGKFLPHYYGWMLHGFPSERSAEAVWAPTH